MKKRIAIFKGRVGRTAQGLPSNVAASIGRTLVRYTFLERLLAQIIYDLLCISIKQGRIIVKLPPARQYTSAVEDLLQFHKIYSRFNFRSFSNKLLAADNARNLFAHSMFVKDEGQLKIQIVRGSWELEQDIVSVSRALSPEAKIVDRSFLSSKRAAVEEAIQATREVHVMIKVALQALNEKRQTETSMDRRQSHQNVNIPLARPQSSQA